MRIVSVITAALLAATLGACSVNPVTGEKELTLMSASQEVATGQKQYVPYQQQQGGRYVVDPEVNLYVQRVGQKLAAVSDRKDLPYEFVVLNNGTPNAWALPGGKIAINRGLLALLDDEAQLAAVLGHEIVHAAARHTARQMTQATLLQAGVMAAGIAAQKTDYGQWIATGAGLGANLWQAHYGRDQELEADQYGVKYMVAAGYDPQAAVELQQKFVALSKGRESNFFNDLFASHPPSKARVERNQVLAESQPGGVRNKAAFERAVKQLKQDAGAYSAYQKGIELAQKNDLTGAHANIKNAIALQPNESLFYITQGQLHMANKDTSSALSAFKKAVQLNPEYYMGQLGLGLAYKASNKKAGAKTALVSSMKILATPIGAYHLGEIALVEGNAAQAKEYFTFAAQGSGQVAQAAKTQLDKLSPPPAGPAQ